MHGGATGSDGDTLEFGENGNAVAGSGQGRHFGRPSMLVTGGGPASGFMPNSDEVTYGDIFNPQSHDDGGGGG